jgi:hypothetical protein
MVALLLYSYALGQRSSRAIERRCHEDVPTRVICANQAPDHTTIARFRVRHQQALARTFTQVLALCARAGLVSAGVVALDGTAMAANASQQATRSSTTIREEVDRMLAEAEQVDAAEDAFVVRGSGPENSQSPALAETSAATQVMGAGHRRTGGGCDATRSPRRSPRSRSNRREYAFPSASSFPSELAGVVASPEVPNV